MRCCCCCNSVYTYTCKVPAASSRVPVARELFSAHARERAGRNCYLRARANQGWIVRDRVVSAVRGSFFFAIAGETEFLRGWIPTRPYTCECVLLYSRGSRLLEVNRGFSVGYFWRRTMLAARGIDMHMRGSSFYSDMGINSKNCTAIVEMKRSRWSVSQYFSGSPKCKSFGSRTFYTTRIFLIYFPLLEPIILIFILQNCEPSE